LLAGGRNADAGLMALFCPVAGQHHLDSSQHNKNVDPRREILDVEEFIVKIVKNFIILCHVAFAELSVKTFKRKVFATIQFYKQTDSTA